MSGATTWKPDAESTSIWCRHEYQDSGKPWHRMTNGPEPFSATCILMPFVWMVRWLIPVMVSPVICRLKRTGTGRPSFQIGIEAGVVRPSAKLDHTPNLAGLVHPARLIRCLFIAAQTIARTALLKSAPLLIAHA